jgi:hypothetical protein
MLRWYSISKRPAWVWLPWGTITAKAPSRACLYGAAWACLPTGKPATCHMRALATHRALLKPVWQWCRDAAQPSCAQHCTDQAVHSCLADQVLHTHGFTGTGAPFLQLVAACALLFNAQHASFGGALAALRPVSAPRSPGRGRSHATRHGIASPSLFHIPAAPSLHATP